MYEFSHLDRDGHPLMVDVSKKKRSDRVARAEGKVLVSRTIFDTLTEHQKTEKGEVFNVAELAGIMAAKRTSTLIPLCHNIGLDGIRVKCRLDEEDLSVVILSEVVARECTGVEMEALTAVTVTALTVYDMCKALGKEMKITDVRLLYKSGGKSGTFTSGEGGSE